MTPADYKVLVRKAVKQGLMSDPAPTHDAYGYVLPQPATLPRDQYYTTAQAAQALGIRATSLNRHFRDKQITPYVTEDNTIRLWLKSDIEAIMAARRPAGRPDDPDYITMTEASKLLSVAPSTVTARAKKHNIEILTRLVDQANHFKIPTSFIRKSQLKLLTK